VGTGVNTLAKIILRKTISLVVQQLFADDDHWIA